MKYIISLGSNTDDKLRKMMDALSFIRRQTTIKISESSGFYNTTALGGGTQNYLNSVIVLDTDMEFHCLNLFFKNLEIKMGRNDETRLKGEVPIDIDIVIADGVIIRPKDYDTKYFQTGFTKLKHRLFKKN